MFSLLKPILTSTVGIYKHISKLVVVCNSINLIDSWFGLDLTPIKSGISTNPMLYKATAIDHYDSGTQYYNYLFNYGSLFCFVQWVENINQQT